MGSIRLPSRGKDTQRIIDGGGKGEEGENKKRTFGRSQSQAKSSYEN